MATATKPNNVKSSFTIKPELFKRLQNFDNKSRIINEALAIYFEKSDYVAKKEEEYWNQKIQEGLFDVKEWNTKKINKNGEDIDSNMLNDTLWA